MTLVRRSALEQEFPAARGAVALLAAGFALALLPALPRPLCAAEAPAKPAARATRDSRPAARTGSLDDALLKDLDNELLEGLDDAPAKSIPGSADKTARPRGAGPPAADAETDPSGAAAGQEPLMRIGQQMRTVERLIPRPAQAEQAEGLQEKIVDELSRLIDAIQQQAQKQQSSSASSSDSSSETTPRGSVKQPESGGPNGAARQSDQPARESTERVGKNEVRSPDAAEIKGLLKDAWGQLPAHAREQMLQSPPERFLPKYELLIEKYYKRLAEEQKPKP